MYKIQEGLVIDVRGRKETTKESSYPTFTVMVRERTPAPPQKTSKNDNVRYWTP